MIRNEINERKKKIAFIRANTLELLKLSKSIWRSRYVSTNIKILDLISSILNIYLRKIQLSLYFLFEVECYSKLKYPNKTHLFLKMFNLGLGVLTFLFESED